MVYLTRPFQTIWGDERVAAIGKSIKENTTYIIIECLPMYSTGCMLISPSGASKLLENLGG